jgi:hypothetical protein
MTRAQKRQVAGRQAEGRQAEGRQASSFFEKKEAKKLFSPWSRFASGARQFEDEKLVRDARQTDKSFFGSFFSKKELLAATCLPSPGSEGEPA